MDRITMPSALLSRLLLIPLRGQESCQKQVVIRHRGRSQKNNFHHHHTTYENSLAKKKPG